MRELSDVLPSVVTGLFTLLAGALVWLGARIKEDGERAANQAKEKRSELLDIYAEAICSIEQAVKCIKQRKPFDLAPDSSLSNAKITLLGSKATCRAYGDVNDSLEAWSRLYVLAAPVTNLVQAPDPSRKYREDASKAFEEMRSKIDRLLDLMKQDLDGI